MQEKNIELAQDYLKRYWGYKTFRPLQKEIIQALIDQKDTIAILPTGAGKSLCFQIPAMLSEGITIVISPLISLMKDQVDTLKELGISAEFINSSLNANDQQLIFKKLHSKQLKLLYLSPERLCTSSMQERLKALPLARFIIDEAHCISQWGHDFRTEYRMLQLLKEQYPQTPIATFTATATPEVQKDIVHQLKIKNPHFFIGNVDRPNLTYRIFRRSQFKEQIIQVLEQHKNEPGIIYCLSRKDVDEFSQFLNQAGYENLPYHAGLSDDIRKQNQSQFALEKTHLIIATVAFGMGIDRSNIRFVAHAAMPQSMEQYQQEVGRAGRDGLPSYGYLFFSPLDYKLRLNFCEESSQKQILIEKLNQIYQFCFNPKCRHKAIVEYFGQDFEQTHCQACDFCLNEIQLIEDPLPLSQKIISCVARLKTPFGADYICRILKGEPNERIQFHRHNELSTFGLLQNESRQFIRTIIDQLVGQNFLDKEEEFSTLSMNKKSWEILKGLTIPKLIQPLEKKARKAIEQRRKEKIQQDWSGIDSALFEYLRKKRSELAQEKGVPAFIIFGDKTLKDMALKKPQTKEQFALLFGVGEQKLKEYADIFLSEIKNYSNLRNPNS